MCRIMYTYTPGGRCLAKRRKSCPFLEVCPCSKCSVANPMEYGVLEPGGLDMTTTVDTFVQLLEQFSRYRWIDQSSRQFCTDTRTNCHKWHRCRKGVYFSQDRDSINPTTPLSMCLCGPPDAGRFFLHSRVFKIHRDPSFPPCSGQFAVVAALHRLRRLIRGLACDSSSPSPDVCLFTVPERPLTRADSLDPVAGMKQTYAVVMSLTRTDIDSRSKFDSVFPLLQDDVNERVCVCVCVRVSVTAWVYTHRPGHHHGTNTGAQSACETLVIMPFCFALVYTASESVLLCE